GPASFRRVTRIGIDLPQFYVEVHVPNVLGGIDVRAGKFYTLMGREVYPAADTDFYSRTYENIYGTPFTHTGILTTVHATGTLDVMAGNVPGWGVFLDKKTRATLPRPLLFESPTKTLHWATPSGTGTAPPRDQQPH